MDSDKIQKIKTFNICDGIQIDKYDSKYYEINITKEDFKVTTIKVNAKSPYYPTPTVTSDNNILISFKNAVISEKTITKFYEDLNATISFCFHELKDFIKEIRPS